MGDRGHGGSEASARPAPPGSAAADHSLAASVAERTGTLLVALRSSLIDGGADAATLRDEGDRRAHMLIVELLAHRLGEGDALLSEEGVDDPTRLATDRVWIVDPLDGTREFGEPPRDDWAVHVGLAVAGVPVAGAVTLPALGLTFRTQPAPRLEPAPARGPRIVVSRSRPPAEAMGLATALGAELVEMGSAGAKAMAVVRGDAEVYVHSGGQYEWDSCAPVAVALAAGLHVSRLDGSPLRYNSADPYIPDLLICRAELAAPALEALATLGG